MIAPDSTQMILQLPQELIDDILDILGAQDSWQALARCLLVSRAFYVRARRNRFAEISTREYMFPSPGRGETERIDYLLQILQDDPLRNFDPLTLHVRSLRLSMFPASDLHSGPATRRPSEWNAQRENLRHVLKLLPNLHTFGLEFTDFMDWNAIHTRMYASIAKLFKSSNLTTLHLTNIYHFNAEHVLAHCVNLRDLRLKNIYHMKPLDFLFRTGGPDPCPIKREKHVKWDPRSLQYLENVESKSASDVFAGIMLAKRGKLLASPFSRLKYLTLNIAHGDFLDEWEAMKCAAASLECLTVSGFTSSHVHSIFPGPIRLSALTSLRTLVLSINIKLPPSPICLAFVFNHILERTTIENVIINFQATSYFTLISEDQFYALANSTSWSTIDDTLTGPSFLSLEEVHLNFRWQYLPSVHVGGDSQENGTFKKTMDTEDSDDDRRKRSQRLGEETLARLQAKAEVTLPKLAHNQRIKCTYNN